MLICKTPLTFTTTGFSTICTRGSSLLTLDTVSGSNSTSNTSSSLSGSAVVADAMDGPVFFVVVVASGSAFTGCTVTSVSCVSDSLKVGNVASTVDGRRVVVMTDSLKFHQYLSDYRRNRYDGKGGTCTVKSGNCLVVFELKTSGMTVTKGGKVISNTSGPISSKSRSPSETMGLQQGNCLSGSQFCLRMVIHMKISYYAGFPLW